MAAIAPLGGPPPGGGPPAPGPLGSLPGRRTCTRHPNRELSAEEIAAGETRCADCRVKNRDQAAVSLFGCSIVFT